MTKGTFGVLEEFDKSGSGGQQLQMPGWARAPGESEVDFESNASFGWVRRFADASTAALQGLVLWLELNSLEEYRADDCYTSHLADTMRPSTGPIGVGVFVGSTFGTTQRELAISQAIDQALLLGTDESFEDGNDTALARSVVYLVESFPTPALNHLLSLVFEASRPSLLSEAVRWIGEVDDSKTHLQRRNFLEAALLSSASEVRDGAALGLSFLEDPKAIPALKQAIDRETLDELRADLEDVVRGLKMSTETPSCSSSAR